mgnify:CR=1 FL=1
MKNIIKSNQKSNLDLINSFEGKEGIKPNSSGEVASYDSVLCTPGCAQFRILWLGRIFDPTLKDTDVIPESKDNQMRCLK